MTPTIPSDSALAQRARDWVSECERTIDMCKVALIADLETHAENLHRELRLLQLSIDAELGEECSRGLCDLGRSSLAYAICHCAEAERLEVLKVRKGDVRDVLRLETQSPLLLSNSPTKDEKADLTETPLPTAAKSLTTAELILENTQLRAQVSALESLLQRLKAETESQLSALHCSGQIATLSIEPQREVALERLDGSLVMSVAEVLALHFGKYQEAGFLICSAMESSTQTTEETLRLRNLQAALLYHSGRFSDCHSLTRGTLHLSGSADSLWGAMYYYTFSCSELQLTGAAPCELPSPKSHLALVLKHCVAGELAFYGDDEEAERCWLQAALIAKQHFPSSIFAAMVSFFLARLYSRQGKRGEAVASHLEAEKTFASHFPASIWNAINLTSLADSYSDIGDAEAALSRRMAASHLYRSTFPTHINLPITLSAVADSYRDSHDLDSALSVRQEAHSCYSTHHPADIGHAYNLTAIGDLYRAKGQLRAAVESRLQAARVYAETHPTHIGGPNNLSDLATLYRNLGLREIAVQARLQAQKTYEAHYPTHINTASNLNSLGVLYCDLHNLKEAEAYYERARGIFAVHYPASTAAAVNLYNLSQRYERNGRIAEALDCAASALRIWSESKNASNQVLAAATVYRLETIRKRRRTVQSEADGLL